jgi:hypothetical protein
MKVSWDETSMINETEVLQLIMGEKPSKAELLLQDYLDISSRPTIQLNPNWWWWIPALPFRINILQGGG